MVYKSDRLRCVVRPPRQSLHCTTSILRCACCAVCILAAKLLPRAREAFVRCLLVFGISLIYTVFTLHQQSHYVPCRTARLYVYCAEKRTGPCLYIHHYVPCKCIPYNVSDKHKDGVRASRVLALYRLLRLCRRNQSFCSCHCLIAKDGHR